MLTSELDYHLPEGLIATAPAEPRDACRLLVVSRSDPKLLEHRRFRDLSEYLRPSDLLVFNTSAVLPAKVQGRRSDTGSGFEGLFIREAEPGLWELMLKTGTRLRPGMRLTLHTAGGAESGFSLVLEAREDTRWRARVESEGGAFPTAPAVVVLARVGATPLPPYIRRAREQSGDQTPDMRDREWYQCVYADRANAGSVAAPTAGLHFTPALLGRLASMGVRRADVRLHVGIGTFKPVDAERAEDHPIHSEHTEVPAETVRALEQTHASGNRVIAVGTTSVRSIESLPHPLTPAEREDGFQTETALYVLPGFAFRHTGGLITNFHLPRSTLLAMVGALFPQGVPRLLRVYEEAVREGYRFYSYGDAMLILP